MLSWMVIYPRGDRNFLDVAQVMDYEKNEWSLASFKEFREEKEAVSYARKLSEEHGIPLSNDPTSDLLHILDLEDDDE